MDSKLAGEREKAVILPVADVTLEAAALSNPTKDRNNLNTPSDAG